MVKQVSLVLCLVLFFMLIFCMFNKNELLNHKIDFIQIMFSSQHNLKKSFIASVEEDNKTVDYNILMLEKYIDDPNLDDPNYIECKELFLKSQNSNISKILLPKIKLCLSRDGNIYQKTISNKYQLSNNNFLDSFSTSGFLKFFNLKDKVIDGWCYQKTYLKKIFHQQRMVLEIDCSGLYNTILMQEKIINKKIIKQNTKYAEGIGLYSIATKYYDEYNKTTKNILINLKSLTSIKK